MFAANAPACRLPRHLRSVWSKQSSPTRAAGSSPSTNVRDEHGLALGGGKVHCVSGFAWAGHRMGRLQAVVRKKPHQIFPNWYLQSYFLQHCNLQHCFILSTTWAPPAKSCPAWEQDCRAGRMGHIVCAVDLWHLGVTTRSMMRWDTTPCWAGHEWERKGSRAEWLGSGGLVNALSFNLQHAASSHEAL
jgi:hypothetical protein